MPQGYSRDEKNRVYWTSPKGDYTAESIERLRKEDRIYTTGTGNVRIKYFAEETESEIIDYRVASNSWFDIADTLRQGHEKVGYPTQKPLALLQRIIAASSNPGDLVLDCFGGSGTTALAAETMKDSEGKAAPRRWISVDCGKFAIHITRKRLIEANARPFAVENIGFYSRAGEWKDLSNRSSSVAKYRDAMTRVYGGAPIEGFTYLHGKKGRTLDSRRAAARAGQRSSGRENRSGSEFDRYQKIDVLTADIPLDFNKSTAEARWGVSIQAKVIPRAAVEAVRARLSRRMAKDPRFGNCDRYSLLFAAPTSKFEYSMKATSEPFKSVLSRLTIDLDDCLSTQDAKKREDIKKAIPTGALWSICGCRLGIQRRMVRQRLAKFRTRKSRDINTQAVHTYLQGGEKRLAVKVTDIFGNDGLRVLSFVLPES